MALGRSPGLDAADVLCLCCQGTSSSLVLSKRSPGCALGTARWCKAGHGRSVGRWRGWLLKRIAAPNWDTSVDASCQTFGWEGGHGRREYLGSTGPCYRCWWCVELRAVKGQSSAAPEEVPGAAVQGKPSRKREGEQSMQGCVGVLRKMEKMPFP